MVPEPTVVRTRGTHDQITDTFEERRDVAYLRIVGEDGVIEIQPEDGPSLRIRTDGGWKTIDTDESVYGPTPGLIRLGLKKVTSRILLLLSSSLPPDHYEQAIEHLVSSLQNGTNILRSKGPPWNGVDLRQL